MISLWNSLSKAFGSPEFQDQGQTHKAGRGMQNNQNVNLLEALKNARWEVDRALQAQWQMLDGQPAAPNLIRLDTQLREAEKRLQSGSSTSPNEFSGIVRWVSDWVPNLDDPLVAAVARLERS